VEYASRRISCLLRRDALTAVVRSAFDPKRTFDSAPNEPRCMNSHRARLISGYQRGVTGVALLAVVLITACTPRNQAADDLPIVRVSIGMSADELKSGSTYPFDFVPAKADGDDLQAFGIFSPYRLVFVDDGAELTLDDLGDEHEFTNITVSQREVSDLLVTLQNGRTNLHDAMGQARRLREWFMRQGYREEEGFLLHKKNGTKVPGSITTLDQAEAGFLDPDLKLSEAVLFGMQKKHVSVGVSLYNTRRMRAQQDVRYDDESEVAQERRYMLTMFIFRESTPKPASASSAAMSASGR